MTHILMMGYRFTITPSRSDSADNVSGGYVRARVRPSPSCKCTTLCEKFARSVDISALNLLCGQTKSTVLY